MENHFLGKSFLYKDYYYERISQNLHPVQVTFKFKFFMYFMYYVFYVLIKKINYA